MAAHNPHGRLADEELYFYEDNIARALNIIHLVPVMARWVGDEELMAMLQVVQVNADRIRASLIDRMNGRKGDLKGKRAVR